MFFKKESEENRDILLPHLHNIKLIFPSLLLYRLNMYPFKFVFIQFLLSDLIDVSNDNDYHDDDDCLCICSQNVSPKEAEPG